jgi:hypothetical protein
MKNWDKKFIELTEFISNWSKDNKRKVGAIIVDDDDSWGESFRFSKEMLYESNINVIFIK